MEKQIKVDNQLDQTINQVTSLLRKRVKHGYFKITINGQIGKGKKREVIISSGEEYKFNIPESDLVR